jgi:hypothetical protein
MKALSLKQPWAELVLLGKKKIELRKWSTNFRGEFYIHTSGNIDEEQMKKYNLEDLPRQSIVGRAILTDVKIYNNEKEFLEDSSKHLASDMIYGRYGFVLSSVKRIEPVKYKGQLRFFEVDLK